MYMTHFFDNPLSAILSDIKPLALSEEHLAAIRALPSFNWYFSCLGIAVS